MRMGSKDIRRARQQWTAGRKLQWLGNELKALVRYVGSIARTFVALI